MDNFYTTSVSFSELEMFCSLSIETITVLKLGLQQTIILIVDYSTDYSSFAIS